MIFVAGASALMVGNYLTTLNQSVEKDLQMLKDLGLDPSWDKHGFSDQDPILGEVITDQSPAFAAATA